MIARSRRRSGDLPSQPAIKRSTCSAVKYFGRSARRQEVSAGTASSKSARHQPWTLRYRKKARRLVTSFSAVPTPHRAVRSKKWARTSLAFQRVGSLPSARSNSIAPREYCLTVGAAAPRYFCNHPSRPRVPGRCTESLASRCIDKHQFAPGSRGNAWRRTRCGGCAFPLSTVDSDRFADAGRRPINRCWPVFRLDLAENGRGGPPRADSVLRWQLGIRLV
jgi:hypothetical protein